jgi:hypothetical protein
LSSTERSRAIIVVEGDAFAHVMYCEAAWRYNVFRQAAALPGLGPA